jgi:O-antigen ligase
MSTYAPTIRFQQRALPGAAGFRAVTSSALMLWIPLALVAVSIYGIEHDTAFSSVDNRFGEEGIDLAKDVAGSSLARELGVIAIGALGGLLLFKLSAKPVNVDWRQMFLIAALCSWLIVSALWAEDAALSLKRSLLPVLLIIGALGIAKHLQPRQICLFTAILTGGFLLLGIAAEIAQGSFLLGSNYRFSGTLHPNNQGVNCAALCLASICLWSQSGTERRGLQHTFWLLTFIVGLAFLMLTQSRTSAIAVAMALLACFALGAPRSRKFMAAAILAPVVVLLATYLLTTDHGSELMLDAVEMGRAEDTGEVTTLTGRIPIWDKVLGDVAERPISGYGYGAFWTTERVVRYTRLLNWEFNHAHSAYLETMLNAGAIGLALGLLIAARALWSAAHSFIAASDSGYLFIVAVIVLALVHGVLDSNFVTVGFAPLLGMLCISAAALHCKSAIDEPIPASTSEDVRPKSDARQAFQRIG